MDIFPFIVGREFLRDDPHYACFMLLNEISTLLFSPIIAYDQVPYLKLIIKQYLEQFKALYPHRPLTPKCHYLLHLPTLILRLVSLLLASCIQVHLCRFGPLVRLWSMRFEGKHKLFKAAARGTSFKNILKTLTHHHQRLMAYNLHFDGTFASVTTTTGTGTNLASYRAIIIMTCIILIHV